LPIADFQLPILAEFRRLRKLLRLSVACEMTLDTFRQQAFAPALTPTRQGSPSALGPHARPKTVLLFAGPFRWLISAFHKTEKSAPRELRAVTLEWSGGLSTQ
jgi:hypothetical protein